MVWNDELKREIPEEWSAKTIGDMAEVVRGTMITEKQSEKGNVKVVAGGLGYSYLNSKYNRKRNTVTISGSGANAGYINFWREDIFASDCTTVRGETDFDTILIHRHLEMYQEHIFRCAKGSAQPHVYPSDIKSIWFYDMPANVKDNLKAVFILTNDQIATLEKENERLVELRDFLLPLLMNGQVSVN
jgi:Restriction endonuclease S subunits